MSSTPSNKRSREERAFIALAWRHYRLNGRHALPWRKTKGPYRILVSEVMLQQTQVDRVIPKYREFLKLFPSASALSRASLGEVLRAWQGLGYNRRAKMLHEAARAVSKERRGRFPRTYEELLALPGIGPYTAGAVLAFAYNIPHPIIETNIRSAYLHHFFGDEVDVDDRMILTLIDRTLDRTNPREWYYALMDYGAHIKQTFGNPNGRSRQYVRQNAFKGSDREIRGAVLRALLGGGKTATELRRMLPFDFQRIDEQTERLLSEGMLVRRGDKYQLP